MAPCFHPTVLLYAGKKLFTFGTRAQTRRCAPRQEILCSSRPSRARRPFGAVPAPSHAGHHANGPCTMGATDGSDSDWTGGRAERQSPCPMGEPTVCTAPSVAARQLPRGGSRFRIVRPCYFQKSPPPSPSPGETRCCVRECQVTPGCSDASKGLPFFSTP